MKQLFLNMGITDRKSFFDFVKQFIKFGLVGVSNTLISLAVYYALVYIDVHYIIANVVAFIVSVLNAYYWNSRYVFSKKEGSNPFFKTLLVYGSTFLLSTGLLYVMVDLLHISELLAPIINLCFTIPLNFLLNKFWAFR